MRHRNVQKDHNSPLGVFDRLVNSNNQNKLIRYESELRVLDKNIANFDEARKYVSDSILTIKNRIDNLTNQLQNIKTQLVFVKVYLNDKKNQRSKKIQLKKVQFKIFLLNKELKDLKELLNGIDIKLRRLQNKRNDLIKKMKNLSNVK